MNLLQRTVKMAINKIKHEDTCPYSPHQNGTIERGWRTYFDMARCLLIESKLPKYLWCYAIMAAVYIRNRCFSQRTKQTPVFLLTKKTPNVKHMHVFGSVCYAYAEKKKKLDNRDEKAFLLGMIETALHILYAFHKLVKFFLIVVSDLLSNMILMLKLLKQIWMMMSFLMYLVLQLHLQDRQMR